MISDKDSWRVVSAIDALNCLDRRLDHLKITRLVRDFADTDYQIRYPKQEIISDLVNEFIEKAEEYIDTARNNLEAVNQEESNPEPPDNSNNNNGKKVAYFPCLKRITM